LAIDAGLCGMAIRVARLARLALQIGSEVGVDVMRTC